MVWGDGGGDPASYPVPARRQTCPPSDVPAVRSAGRQKCRASEMTDVGQKLVARTARDGCGPPGQVRPRTVEDDDPAVPRRAGAEATVDSPSSRRARQQSRRRSGDRVSSLRSQTTGLRLAPRIRSGTTSDDFQGNCRPCRRLVSHVYCPHRTPDAGQVLGRGDLLVAQKLGPRAVGCVTEVVSRPFALRVPSPGRLRTTLPQKRIAGIGVPERDHVAGEETKAAARSRTPLRAGILGLPRAIQELGR